MRGYRPGDRIRVAHGTTTVQVAVTAAASGKGVLRFHQEHLADADARERRREHRQSVMAEVVAALDERPKAG